MTAKDMTTYLLVCSDGKKKITVPSSWKVTYGPVSPGSKFPGSHKENVIRFYEAENKQRAMFTNVKEFRDLSIQVQEQRVVKSSQAVSVADSKGKSESADYDETYEWEEVA